MKTVPIARSDEAIDALGKAILFRSLPERARRAIVQECHARSLRTGERLWSEGEEARHLGLVLAGRLKVTRTGARDVLLEVAVPSEVLGEVAFTTGASYQHDVTCLRGARVLLIPASVVRARLAADPAMAMALALDLAEHVVRLTRLAEDLSAGGVEMRLARVLLRLAERAGEPFPGGTLIPLRLRRSDLAAMAATTLESTSRRIADWQRRGVIQAQPAGYLIRDLAALRALADHPA